MSDIVFTEDQQKAFDGIMEFFQGKTNQYALLEGCAGSGKSTITSYIIRDILENHSLFGKVAISAPTHKALKVIKAMFTKEEQEKMTFSSLHSLLGLKHQITSNGKEIFKRDPKSICKLSAYDLIIVDEASMIADELFHELDEQNFTGVKVLFVGDSNQINPINHIHSIPMLQDRRDEYNVKHFRLTKIVRQAEGNPIIQTSQKVLNDQFQYIQGDKNLIEKKGVVTLNNDPALLKKLLQYYFCSEEFDENPDHAKLLAWTNRTVDSFNLVIRNLKYGKVPKIVKGEKLLMDRPLFENEETIFTTNEEIEVLELNVETKKLYNNNFDYYKCLVKGDDIEHTIHILHENSEKLFDTELKKLAAIADKEKEIKTRVRKWREYYNFMNEFSSVNYNYALTVHNSQGSTYKNTFIVYSDINRNMKKDEKQRILYTAMTRPKEMLYII